MSQKPSYEELENRIKQLEHIVLGAKQSDERLLSIMSEAEKLANFGAWEWDMIQNKWTMSDNWLKIHGCKNKVLTTEDLLAIAHPDDINRIQEAFNQSINHGAPYNIEHRIVRYKTKEVRYIRAYGRVESDSTGKPVKMYGAAQDITEYKFQEVELIQSEEQYRSLVERTPDLVTKVDTEGRIVFVNHAAQNIYGIPPEECLGRSAFAFIHPEDREVTVASFNGWLRCPDNVLIYENRIISIDGQRTHHMTWMILPERDESGSVIGFAGTARDITARKQVEKEREQFFSFFQTSADLMCIADPHGFFLKINPAFKETLGYSEDELLSKPILEFVHPDDRQATLDEIARQLQRGMTESFQNRYLCKNGSLKWFSWRVNVNKDEGIVYATARDITEWKKVDEALRSSRNLLQTILENVPTHVFWKDTESNYLGSNTNFARAAGFSRPEDLLGKDDFQMCWHEQAELYRADDKRVMASGEPVIGIEEPQTAPDGQTLCIRTSKVPLHDVEGKVFGMLGIFDEITEHKIIEEERERLLSQLEQKTAEQERFIYTVSHDLKSPLITISGFCDLAKRGYVSGDQVQLNNSLDIISNAADRMNQLLNDLLHISRIGIKKNQSEIVKLEVLIKESIENVSGVIVEHKTAIEIEPELPDVLVDRQYLLQVIENLLSNASKYSHSATGGSNVKFGVIRNEEELICYVKDNGIGIETEYLEKIFGLFERLDVKSDGTGVGLTIVKRIIETHGGRIWAESEGLGHGTTFFFTLPEP